MCNLLLLLMFGLLLPDLVIPCRHVTGHGSVRGTWKDSKLPEQTHTTLNWHQIRIIRFFDNDHPGRPSVTHYNITVLGGKFNVCLTEQPQPLPCRTFLFISILKRHKNTVGLTDFIGLTTRSLLDLLEPASFVWNKESDCQCLCFLLYIPFVFCM